jgi:hypothetical protein
MIFMCTYAYSGSCWLTFKCTLSACPLARPHTASDSLVRIICECVHMVFATFLLSCRLVYVAAITAGCIPFRVCSDVCMGVSVCACVLVSTLPSNYVTIAGFSLYMLSACLMRKRARAVGNADPIRSRHCVIVIVSNSAVKTSLRRRASAIFFDRCVWRWYGDLHKNCTSILELKERALRCKKNSPSWFVARGEKLSLCQAQTRK